MLDVVIWCSLGAILAINVITEMFTEYTYLSTLVMLGAVVAIPLAYTIGT